MSNKHYSSDIFSTLIDKCTLKNLKKSKSTLNVMKNQNEPTSCKYNCIYVLMSKNVLVVFKISHIHVLFNNIFSRLISDHLQI